VAVPAAAAPPVVPPPPARIAAPMAQVPPVPAPNAKRPERQRGNRHRAATAAQAKTPPVDFQRIGAEMMFPTDRQPPAQPGEGKIHGAGEQLIIPTELGRVPSPRPDDERPNRRR
jgi:hypothetical protein